MKISFLAFTLFVALNIKGQNPKVQSLEVRDGLSQGMVHCITQDSRGFIWIGTSFGLNRYDGYGLKEFKTSTEDHQLLLGNGILSITEDKRKMLWLGTDAGIVVFDPYSQVFESISKWLPEMSGVLTKLIHADLDGNIWIVKKDEEHSLIKIEIPESIVSYFRSLENSKVILKSKKLVLPKTFGKKFGAIVDEDTERLVLINMQGESFEVNKSDQVAKPAGKIQQRRLHKHISLFNSKNLKTEWLHFHNNNASSEELKYKLFRVLTNKNGKKHIIKFGANVSYLLDESILRQYPTPFNENNILGKLPIYKMLDQQLTESGCIDQSGNLWLGTLGYGIRILSEKKLGFNVLQKEFSFLNMCQFDKDKIWSGRIKPYVFIDVNTGEKINPEWIRLIYPNENLLYFKEGVNKNLFCTVWDRKLNVFRFLQIDLKKIIRINLKEDIGSFERENAFIGFLNEETVCFNQPGGIVSFFNTASKEWALDSLEYSPSKINYRNRKMLAMTETNMGKLWISSNTGIYEFVKNGNKVIKKHYSAPVHSKYRTSSNGILCLTPSPGNNGVVWLGTKGAGLGRLIPNLKKFEIYKTPDQIKNQLIYGIISENSGNLWFSTNNGISRLDINTGALVTYNSIYPELKKEYNTGACLAINKDLFLFGSVEGLVKINPSLLLLSAPPARVEWTDIEVNEVNKTFKGKRWLTFNEKGVPSLKLTSGEQSIKVSFSASSAEQPKLLSYRYKVIGLHSDWINLGNQNSFILESLTPGIYELQIQSMSGEQVSTDISSLYIKKQWPWYRTYLAWIFYITTLVFIFIHWQKTKEQRQMHSHKMTMQEQELKRILELDSYRKSFFSYIVHEFKTPLSIIAGLTRKLHLKQDHNSGQNVAQSIDYQTDVMLELIDQMMDITKLEEGKLELNLQYGDLKLYVEQIISRFEPIARYKQIELTYYTTLSELMTKFDPARTKHILTNLLSNALRFTQIGGLISVSLSTRVDDIIQLVVTDNGTGIDPAFLPNIFQKYSQSLKDKVNNHTFGLGLAYVKELVELHRGTIYVDSTVGKGSTFAIDIPLIKDVADNKTDFYIDQQFDMPELSAIHDPSRPLVLLVEDNASMGGFLISHLTADYHMLVASNGEEGFKTAVSEVPDLIITDVMMPVMNGIEMSELCKNHPLTSHIPIIMLSGKSEINDKLIGLEAGVDVYLSKPVNTDELLFATRNLLKRQKKWKEFNRHKKQGTDMTGAVLPFDERAIRSTNAFLDSIYEIFEINYQKDDFDMPLLYKNLSMSKSQFHRKLKVISELSANEMLTQFRIEKSVEILRNNELVSLKEIAYQVGFKDPAYFSRIFTKKFGVSPSKYIKSTKGKE